MKGYKILKWIIIKCKKKMKEGCCDFMDEKVWGCL